MSILFSDLGLSENMLKSLSKKGFETASDIQALVIPEFLKEHSHIIGQAQTGTGKTIAFAIPILETLVPGSEPKALILAPTRELALQVCEEMHSLIGDKKFNILTVYGGASIEQQIKALKRGVDIVVGTPGRVLDLINKKKLVLKNLDFFVLDEADEMLNMGFVDDIEEILHHTNAHKKMLFFSATMPDSILKIAKNYMGKFKILKVENKQLTTGLTEQIYFEVREHDKFSALCRVLDFETDFYGIIFCRTKLDVDEVTRRLKENNYAAEGLHGDVPQNMRTKVLGSFKEKVVNILVATDVAARGIDVNNLTHVINYSIANEAEAYIHRIGRTGRAGNRGIAITFVTPREASKLYQIERVTKSKIKQQAIPSIADIIKVKKDNLEACIDEIIAEQDYTQYEHLAGKLIGDEDPVKVVAALLRHVYQDDFIAETYKNIDSSIKVLDNTRLFIALGRKDGMTPRKLLDYLNKQVKTPGRKVKDIKILDAFSFISVPLDEAEIIMRKLNQGNRVMVEKAKQS